MSQRTSFFLGANTPEGFVSFFDELYNPYKSCNAYIIKGGPGTGKSTLMKKIGNFLDTKGYDTSFIYCSSDEKSLDALCVPGLNLCIADGTSPHTLEPKFPGVAENIINAGEFWDKSELKKHGEKIRSLTVENSLHHRRSSGYLAAAGKLLDDNIRVCRNFIREEKINSFAVRFAARECGKSKKGEPGKKYKCFLSGITPSGCVFRDDTIEALCTRVIGIEDECSAVSNLLCEECAYQVLKRGYDVIFCHCPMRPRECEHIIIPELSLCLLTVKKAHPIKVKCDRVIHSKRFMTDGISGHKRKLDFNRKVAYELLLESITCLKSAKSIHDELEKIYISAMDFNAFNEYAEKLKKEIYGLTTC